MAQIKKFKSKKNKIEEWLKEIVKTIKDENLDKIIIAGTSKNNPNVCTAYYGCDIGDKQLLNSHIQIDIIDETIIANIERYRNS